MFVQILSDLSFRRYLSLHSIWNKLFQETKTEISALLNPKENILKEMDR